jgi:hypothetical protein
VTRITKYKIHQSWERVPRSLSSTGMQASGDMGRLKLMAIFNIFRSEVRLLLFYAFECEGVAFAFVFQRETYAPGRLSIAGVQR